MKLKNKSKITRSTNTSKHNFTPISNVMIQGNLSLEAVGLISFMISLPETWVIYKDNIRNMCKIGRAKFDRIWKECSDAGYIKSEKMKNDSNQFIGWSHMVSDNIIVQNPNVGKPDSRENRRSENHTVYKRDTDEKIELEKNIEKEIIVADQLSTGGFKSSLESFSNNQNNNKPITNSVSFDDYMKDV